MIFLLVLLSLATSGTTQTSSQDCTADSDCNNGYCDTGKCARYAQTGESCGGIMPPIGVCASGLDCIVPYNPNVANLPGRCGRGCKTNSDCQSGMTCDIPSKNCLAYLQEGASCESDSTSVCAQGLTCSHGTCTKGYSGSSTTYPLQGTSSSSEYSSGTYGSPSSSAGYPRSPARYPSSPAGYPSSPAGYPSSPVATGPGHASSPVATGPGHASSPTGPSSGSSVPSGPGYGSSPSGYPSPSSPTSWSPSKHKQSCGGFVIGHSGSTGQQTGGPSSGGTRCTADSDCTGGKRFCDSLSSTCMTYRALGENCGNAGTLTPYQCAPGLRCLASRPLPGAPRSCVNDANVTCPPRLPAVSCFTDPCNVSSCEGYPNATCQADYCGGCNTKWSMGGQAVQCKPADCSNPPPCPKIPETCNTTMTPFGRCCPVCADCSTVFCPAIFCDNPVPVPGACCPVCPSNPGIPIPNGTQSSSPVSSPVSTSSNGDQQSSINP